MSVGDVLILIINALQMSTLRLHAPQVRNTTPSSERSPLIDEENSVITYAATYLRLIKNNYRK